MTFKGSNNILSEEQELSQKCFGEVSQGNTSKFLLECANMKKVTDLKIRRDKTGDGDDWWVFVL